jgi:hypothetical protein
MTTEMMVRFFQQRPFEPFTLILANGREHQINHLEQAAVGRSALVVYIFHPTRQIEAIDTAMIVSIRTICPADMDVWTR